jgi:uncharacterized membrane protein YecN with MAPEG domain
MSEIEVHRDEVRTRQRAIAGSLWWTGAVLLLGIPAAFAWVVPAPELPEIGDKLAYALRCNAVAAVPYLAVCTKIMVSRFFEGAHDPLSHTPSKTLEIDCRVMQNHLEQTFLFTVSTLALASMLDTAPLRILPIATAVFVLGRFVFWWGYHRAGTLGRAPGVQLTFGVTIPLALVAAGMALRLAFVA